MTPADAHGVGAVSVLSELSLSLDERLEAPVGLTPLTDPNVHSCGTVYPTEPRSSRTLSGTCTSSA
ncbi:hypothetical protein Scani_67810 [Streptomyces caniferus]|uniref:Uncharacterized protein n=1 Tax=Streptomyces caniferus TaxID=285557 RepID=A0A640SGH1_9ACTN|nr:hypothetical protein Scani_67810 [Streptomyces caniferus]